MLSGIINYIPRERFYEWIENGHDLLSDKRAATTAEHGIRYCILQQKSFQRVVAIVFLRCYSHDFIFDLRLSTKGLFKWQQCVTEQ